MTPLHIQDVSKHFGSADTPPALSEVSLAVDSGELLVLLGPSGSGKTTLLRCIAGLIEPSSGTIRIGEHVVVDCAAGVHVATHKRGLGMVFQNFALWPHMTVKQNVAYPLAKHSQGVDDRVMEMLTLVRCEPMADRLPSTLSGGQQQRIALARALAGSPALLLFDEPLSNLDALLRIELRTQLRLIHRMKGFTGIYVTHDQGEALSLGTRVAVMNQGHIEQIGTPEEIYCSPASDFVADFMGMGNQLIVDGSGLRCDGSGRRVAGFGSEFRKGNTTERTAIRFRPESLVVIGNERADQAATQSPGRLAIDDLEVLDRAFGGEHIEYSLQSGTVVLKARMTRGHALWEVGERVCGLVSQADTACFEAPAN